MYSVRTVLLIDNEDQVLAKAQILALVMTEIALIKGCVLATADFASGIDVMEATGVDLVAIAGNSHTSLLYRRIISLQQQFPGVVVIALIDSNESAILQRVLSATGCHRCVSLASGNACLAKIICRETRKLAQEKHLITEYFAAERSSRQNRLLVQTAMDS